MQVSELGVIYFKAKQQWSRNRNTLGCTIRQTVLDAITKYSQGKGEAIEITEEEIDSMVKEIEKEYTQVIW